MADLPERYRRAFATLGYDLRPSDGCSELQMVRAEKRLGVQIPKALKEYYLIAGRERCFNRVHNRLLRPNECFLDSGRLVFMEENQAVVLWGVPVTPKPLVDPPVFQGVNNDLVAWYPEHDKCSVFLTIMLHWQGAFGGAMRFASTATLPKGLVKILDSRWQFVGEVNKMRAYSRPGRAVCFLKWDDALWKMRGGSPWRIFAAASTEEGMKEIAQELKVVWESEIA